VKYKINITPAAEKEYLKLPRQVQEKARIKILALEDNPRPYGSKKLKNTDFYRLRLGDYRIVYAVYEEKKLVKILAMGHRRDVYR